VTALVLPTLDLYDAWAACVREFGDEVVHGSGFWNLTDGRLEPTRESCAALVEIAERQADRTTPPDPGKVHCSQYWVTDGGDVIGFVSFRHELNDFLLAEGGHIGYAIRPSRRREGHASRALALTLDRARDLGLARVLVTCDDANLASARTIERNGGVLEDVRNSKRRYWIELGGELDR